MSFHERLQEQIEKLRQTVWQGAAPQAKYPERQFNVGSDVYVVRPGESWSSIAFSVYGSEKFAPDLRNTNRGYTVLHPGMRLVLPDRKEDPQVPVGNEDFWNTPDFANQINAQDEQRRLISEYRQAEQIWPEHGDEVYIGFDEDNDPYPTTDSQGMSLFWDPKTESPVFEDTGVRYTMGMIENDWIKPLSIEDQRELTLRGEQAFRPEAMAYYAQAAESEGFKDAIIEAIPEDSAFVPTLHDLPRRVSTELRWWESALDFFSLGEETFRGVFNVALREGAEGREGYNMLERSAQIIVAFSQAAGILPASFLVGIRDAVVSIFDKELRPYAVDSRTWTKLTPDEVEQLESAGRGAEIKYVKPNDYWSLELDRATTTALRWFQTIYAQPVPGSPKGTISEEALERAERMGIELPETRATLFAHFGGIYRDQFDSQDDYEQYIGSLFAFYPEFQDEALERNLETQRQEEGTRRDYQKLLSATMEEAFTVARAGDGEEAITLMNEAMQYQTRASHWYSPYFMWSDLNEPWRNEAFLEAAAILTLKNGEPLEPRTVRDLRRQYEHPGADIVMGIVFDILNITTAVKAVRSAARLPARFVNMVAGLNISDKLSNLKPTRPVMQFLKWFTGEAYGSAGTTLKRQVNQITFQVSRGVDSSISIPGVRGLDEEMELLFRGIREDPELLLQLGANARSPLQIKNAQRMINMFDPTSELSAVKKINPDNIGGLVREAYESVWRLEYQRAMQELKGASPDLLPHQLEAEAARIADRIASKPKLIARQIGSYYELAWRAQHRTELGAQTLDDNIFVEIGKLTGTEDIVQGQHIRGAFKLYYGVRNSLFEWWLGLRPAWTIINFQDSVARSLISGAKLFDNLGFASVVNRERLLSRNLIREEFTSSFSRGLREVADDIIQVEPAVDKWLRGRRFTFGPLSHINDARHEKILELAALRADQPTTTGLGRAVRWMIDQARITKSMFAKGALDMNSLIEFGLRERVFATHYDKAFDVMDAHNLETMVELARLEGASDEAIAAFRKMWAMAGDDAEQLSTLMTVRDPSLRGGPRPVVFSELLPDNFEEVLESLLVDRRLRTLIFRPMVEELETIVRNAPDGESAAREAVTYIEDAIRNIDAEFVARSDEFAPQPARVEGATQAIDDVAEVTEDAARTVDLGDELEVTIEQLRINDQQVSAMSEAYHARGALQQEAAARLGDMRTELQQSGTLADDVTDADEVRAAAEALKLDKFLAETSSQLTFFRDRAKQFILRVFPGPLKYERGPLRDAAWEGFDRIGTQIYDTVITYMDDAIEIAAAGDQLLPAARELPSMENLLRTAGIVLQFDGTRLSAVRIADDVMGTQTSFTGWRASNWIKVQLSKSFFGPRINIRNAAEWYRQPFTADARVLSETPMTRSEVAEQLASQFGEEIGRATDQAIREADQAWRAVVNNPELGGGLSLRQRWGNQVTGSRQDFLDFLEGEIGVLREMGLNEESISAVQQLLDEVRGIGLTIDQLTDPFAVLDIVPRPLPRWLLDQGIQTWLQMQRGMAAERSGLTRALRAWGSYLDEGLRGGAVELRSLASNQAEILSNIAVRAVDRKMLSSTLAADGTKALQGSLDATTSRLDPTEFEGLVSELNKVVTGSDEAYQGAVGITQFDMLEYGKNYRFDNIMKFISPFWMFQSRSPLFWLKTAGQHPVYAAWISRYYRQNRRHLIENGATDSSGRPLKRLYGYWRIPGSSTFVAPLNGSSSRYVIPRPSPYPADFTEDTSAMEVALTYMYEYGSMFGFRPAPWITYPLYATDRLDPNRLPIGGLISHVGLIPPWWQRDMRRALRIERYPNDPGLWSPDVGWQDFLIHKQMLGTALIELEENPDSLPEVQAELYEALGYQPGELGDFGEPLSYKPIDTVYYRESPRWAAARDKIEKDQWANQWTGFITSVYPKSYTDAEGALLALRDDLNFLQDSINSLTNTPVFALDPVAESRYEIYNEKQFETPEGFIDQIYGAARWTQLPGGGQAYGEDRIEIIAKRIWENEVTAAYYDSLTILQDEFTACQKSRPLGSDSALHRACWSTYFEGRAAIDDAPIFDIARRDWAVGYKTEGMIKERFEWRWWSYINATRPRWYVEDGEEYENWRGRTEEWLENLPTVAEELAAVFLVTEISPKTGDYETGEGQEIPGGRALIEEAVIQKLVSQTNEDGYNAHRMANDTAYDAMNEAWKALRWDPYQTMIAGQDEMNSYEKELAERAFMDKYGDPPELAELQRWVIENYPEDSFTPEELAGVMEESGAASLTERALPNSERGVVENDVWETLAIVGPGANFTVFEEEFILAGGDPDVLNTWYETGGHISDFDTVEELFRRISLAASKLDLGPPSQALLVEWSGAKNLNDDFREGIESMLGEGFYEILGIYGALRNPRKKDYRAANEEILKAYFDAREYFAGENQLWAKYYYPKFYEGGVGIPGQGADKLYSSSGRSGGGVGRKGTSPRGAGARVPKQQIVPAGYRSTYFAHELRNPNKLGTGGIGGQPVWPLGFGKGVKKGVLTEIVKLFDKDEPLSEAAVTYLENRQTFKEYIRELLKKNQIVRARIPRFKKFGP